MRQFAVVALVVLALAVPAVGGAATGPAAQSQSQEQCSFPVTATDATGTEVTVEGEPQRVVVLGPSAAQVMWEIGAKDKVVGMPVNQNTAYLNGSEERTNVVDENSQPERETVVGLNPDLVLAPNIISNETVQQLRQDGLTVYRVRLETSFQDIYDKTELFGRMVGNCEGANQTVSEMKNQVQTVREAVQGEDRPRVLYTFYGYTVTDGAFIHEVVETAGGNNVAANISDRAYAQINEETVAQRDPQWVVVPSDASLPEGEPWTGTTAYERNQTLTVNANYMSQAGPRVVQPLTKLAKAFHPQAFAEANATATATATETETGTSMPGFGVGATVAALLALATTALARRR